MQNRTQIEFNDETKHRTNNLNTYFGDREPTRNASAITFNNVVNTTSRWQTRVAWAIHAEP